MTICYPALYSDSKGPDWCWEQPRTRRMFDQSRCGGVKVHGTSQWLIKAGTKLTEDIRKEFPTIDIIWAVSSRKDPPDPMRLWCDASRAAQDANTTTFEFDCEGSWKQVAKGRTLGDKNRFARDRLLAVHEAAPKLKLSHTAYREPMAHTSTNDRATGLLFPYKGFCGDDSPLSIEVIQMYGLTALSAEARAIVSVQKAKAAKIFKKDLEIHTYLLSCGNGVGDLIRVGLKYPTASFWDAQPGHLSDDGMAAIHAISELTRRGFKTVKDFQISAGLKPDNEAGWKETLPALGVPRQPTV